MIFKIDENLPADAAALLREHGFDTDTVNDEGLLGANDDVIASAAVREGRVLITLDRDFSAFASTRRQITPVSSCFGRELRTSPR